MKHFPCVSLLLLLFITSNAIRTKVGEPINNSVAEEKELYNVDYSPTQSDSPINNPLAAEEEEVTMDYSSPSANHLPSAEEEELNVDYTPAHGHPPHNNLSNGGRRV
ncbi:hypothetical protein Dsin_029502 [Dipteronia sinensis]|uniref:Encoded peptide n=1 Tax=Dipteronia sinensis TaxID=43782 RepID=A0AAE0DVJ4_9ROSI|nr:hypothetical protein Dsin_029502 [Dipteronia sinensis]